MLREIRHALQSECPNDRAAVGQVALYRPKCRTPFGRAQPQAREHLGKMPAHLVLLCRPSQMEQPALVRLESRRIEPGGFLESVCCAHADDRVGVAERGDERAHEVRVGRQALQDFGDPPDRSPVAAAQQLADFVGLG